jgi:hypothetical protein
MLEVVIMGMRVGEREMERELGEVGMIVLISNIFINIYE